MARAGWEAAAPVLAQVRESVQSKLEFHVNGISTNPADAPLLIAQEREGHAVALATAVESSLNILDKIVFAPAGQRLALVTSLERSLSAIRVSARALDFIDLSAAPSVPQ